MSEKTQRQKLHESAERVLRHMILSLEKKVREGQENVGLNTDEERAVRAALAAYRLTGAMPSRDDDVSGTALSGVSSEELEKLLGG